jgi:RES domain-containing protein
MVDVDAVTVVGEWWRHIPAGTDPLWFPADPPSGRWQQGTVVAGFYLADSPDTAWAEWYRALAEAGLPPEQTLPRDLWSFEVEVTAADLSTPDRMARVGLGPLRPRRIDWLAYQNVGHSLHDAGWKALLAPSAARPAHQTLCVFRSGVSLPGVEPLRPPQRVDTVPTPPRGMTT